MYFPKPSPVDAKFSIIIPTWNNLPYLKVCLDSLQKNSHFPHQIILHVNEGKDGTIEYVRNLDLAYTYTPENAGLCVAMNMMASLATTDYIVYVNDDMYACPDWDLYLWEEIQALDTDKFFLSSTMIEWKGNNDCAIAPYNFGESIADFREADLLAQFADLPKNDWNGATWPPNVVTKKIWDLVGGYSVEFSPGMYSDPDFSMKLWQVGVRIFKGIAKSRFYHFISKSTGKLSTKKNGAKQFLDKWGISSATFSKYYLQRGTSYTGVLPEPDTQQLGFKLKQWGGWWKKLFL